MKFIITIMGLCIFLFSPVIAGTIDPNTPDSKYIEYGDKFNSVTKLCCYDGKNTFCGSAVVIDPHWIVTAAHVVENCHSWTITLANNKQYKLSKMIAYPKYNFNIFGEFDIALGYSEEYIELDGYPELYTDNDEVGKLCSMAGWGLTGTFNTGVSKSDGKRRGGANFIDRIEKKVLICSPSKSNEKMTELEYLICSGDSGGGLFIDGKLAGIHSSVLGYDGKPDSTYKDESCHTRVSLYADWIKTTMENKGEKKK